ncbi:MAG: hypothetical protein INR70_27945 [Parafilimonas terrae]|nr:hypothetical protein [Parafilimonas terrae]
MANDAPFDFKTCKRDEATCLAAMQSLFSPNLDWSEVHCGLCGATGVVQHPKPAAAAQPAPAPAKVSAPATAPAAATPAAPGSAA